MILLSLRDLDKRVVQATPRFVLRALGCAKIANGFALRDPCQRVVASHREEKGLGPMRVF